MHLNYSSLSDLLIPQHEYLIQSISSKTNYEAWVWNVFPMMVHLLSSLISVWKSV